MNLDQMEQIEGGESPYLCATVGFLAGVVTGNPFIGLGYIATRVR